MGTQMISVLGLGFGDCGKGMFIDALARNTQAHTVVRFNGGAQAAHNVVLPDGRHHTFSQFGAATFVPGVRTLLSYPVVVHPTALLVENAYLQRAGVHDAMQRLVIDRRCRITTPFHQAAGRMRELQRGPQAHGSCGVGVGETVRLDLEQPSLTLHYGDLPHTATTLARLDAIRRYLLAAFDPVCAVAINRRAYAAELQVLRDTSVAQHWLQALAPLLVAAGPAEHAEVVVCLQRHGTVLFEGAQGVLLDEWRGFHPYTTWSTIHPSAVEAVVADAGMRLPVMHLGALRSFMTRHGNGPMPSHDARLAQLPEPHNASGNWQGDFRRGHPDAVLLRYALAATGPLDGLLVSHLDAFERQPGLRWCHAYDAPRVASDAQLCVRNEHGKIAELRLGGGQDLHHQAALADLLSSAQPHLAPEVIADARQFVGEVEALAGLPVLAGSFGPTFETVKRLSAARAA